ncbi:MAG: right-handed parallel beta-helix repeat-containing protein, partial [Fimbriimonadaceae bacterium]
MLWPILLAAPPALPVVTLTPGMKITSSVRVRPGTYILPNAKEDGSGAAIFIEGDNITIDLSGVTIRGTEPTVEPDQRKGTGLLIEGTGVEIRNAKVHGYKVGIMARHSPGLKITNSDLSYNWKQRLKSTLEKEDTSDWMSYHQNDKNEWLRYGAALYLDNCDRFEVRDVVARGGQNGLMMTRTDGGLVWNSDFSFLSSVGVGMYRSSGNRIMHNNIDWCVRGYSHGVYNRGQDSTGILIYEQSHRNVFAYNSVTHGGDGFFLWAGQTTMDTGEGGCNDNLLFGNDFSHAPTNGIEATFSRNQFVNNKVMECWHGVWGGYSYDTLIAGNVFGLNAEAIAIEHGQDNKILGNTFRRDRNVLRIWQNASQDPNWGYPKHRDTKSRDLAFEWNLVADVDGPAFVLTDTDNVSLRHNLLARLAKPFELKGNLPGLRFENS